MKKFLCSAANLYSCGLLGMGLLFLSTPSFASLFEECKVTARVVSIEELSVFSRGSKSVPSGVNPDSKEIYSFKRLLTLEVLALKTPNSHDNCKKMLGNHYKVILDSKDELAGVVAEDQLNVMRKRVSQLTRKGVAYQETWDLLASIS